MIYHDSFVFLFFLLVRNTSHCQGKYRLLDKTSAENIQVLAVILRSVCFIKNKHVVSFGETARGPEVLVATYKRDCAPIPFTDYGRRLKISQLCMYSYTHAKNSCNFIFWKLSPLVYLTHNNILALPYATDLSSIPSLVRLLGLNFLAGIVYLKSI